MAASQRGVAVFWGLGSTFAATGTGMPSGTGVAVLPQSIDQDVESQTLEVQNYDGQTVAKVFFDQKQLLKFEVIPSADTIAHAKAGSLLPLPGAIVTIADTDDPEAAANNAGKYIFVRGSKRRSNKDVVKLTFELEQWIDADNAVVVA